MMSRPGITLNEGGVGLVISRPASRLEKSANNLLLVLEITVG